MPRGVPKADGEETPSLSSIFGTATDAYMAVQAAKYLRGDEDNAWTQGSSYYGRDRN